jgi:hypothetical protein
MRVRLSLDFDILIESFISLCIIETVGAICRGGLVSQIDPKKELNFGRL